MTHPQSEGGENTQLRVSRTEATLSDVGTERPFDEGECDSLDILATDAYQDKRDAEATQKAFGAIETLATVLGEVRDEKCSITDTPRFLEQLRRLNQIAQDYYAATGRA